MKCYFVTQEGVLIFAIWPFTFLTRKSYLSSIDKGKLQEHNIV